MGGIDGKNGIDGKDGLDGKDGIAGKDGLDGNKGEKGLKGDGGNDGIDGKDGEKGDQGEKGLKGNQGIPGIDADPCLKFEDNTKPVDMKCLKKIWKLSGCKGDVEASDKDYSDKDKKIYYMDVKDKKSQLRKKKEMEYGMKMLYDTNQCPFGGVSNEEKNKLNGVGPKGRDGKDADLCSKFGENDQIDLDCFNQIMQQEG